MVENPLDPIDACVDKITSSMFPQILSPLSRCQLEAVRFEIVRMVIETL